MRWFVFCVALSAAAGVAGSIYDWPKLLVVACGVGAGLLLAARWAWLIR